MFLLIAMFAAIAILIISAFIILDFLAFIEFIKLFLTFAGVILILIIVSIRLMYRFFTSYDD